MNASRTNNNKFGMTGRYTLRITPGLNRDLHQLGRIEKRRMAKMVRTCLATALAEWRKTHPGKSPLKTPRKSPCKLTLTNS